MKFRFKLRTLLIATALIGLFLGLQIHVHNKAKRFVKEMSEVAERDDGAESAWIESLSVSDVLGFRRRCAVVWRRTKGERNGLKYSSTVALVYEVRLTSKEPVVEGQIVAD